MAAFAELDLVARTDQLERATAEIRRIGVEGEKTEQKVEKATSSMNAGMHKLASAAGILVGSLLSMQTAMAAITSARQMDAALAETSTLLAGNADQMKIVEAGARSMAREFGGSATAQVHAYYQAISAGAGDAEAATKLLDGANRLAIGGLVDVTTAVDVLTTATNAYKASGLTAAEASDALFTGMRLGKTTITELSAAVGGVLPLAVSLGVSFDETVAAMAALTTQGIETSQAATGVRAALTSMIAPSDEAQKLAAKLGIEFSAAGVQARGFGGVMDQIIEKTGGNTAAIQQLFGSVEATTAALSFAGGAGEVYSTIMEEMAIKTGATTEAFGLMADSMDQRLIVVMAQGQDLLLALGNVLLEVLVPALENGVAAISFVAENMDALMVITAGLAATQIPAIVIALGAKAAAMLAAASAAGIATGAITALNAAMAFMGGPIGIAAGVAVAALGAAYLVVRNNAEPARGFVDDLNVKFSEVPGFADAADSAARRAAGGFSAAGGAASAAAQQIAALNAEMAASTGFDPGSFSGDAFRLDPIIVDGGGADGIEGYLGGLGPVLPDPVLPGLGDDDGDKPSGGGGASASDGFEQRLEQLTEQLATERELVDQWYEESMEILDDRRAMEILGAEEHAAALLAVEEEMIARKRALQDQDLSNWQGFFGSMAQATQAGGNKLLALSKGFALAEAAVSIWRGAAKALELPYPANIAAWGHVIATGAQALAGISGASFGGGGGGSSGSGSSGSSYEATPEPTQAPKVVRLDVQGEGIFADMLRESGQAIVDAITNEGDYGGTTIVMGR